MSLITFNGLPATARELILEILKAQPNLLASFVSQGKSADEAVTFIVQFLTAYAEQIMQTDLSAY